jgi:hypothetical protein
MSSRVSKLLTDIRAELADPEKDRWSDSRLLTLLSQAQTEIALETRVLIARKTIPIIAGQREYILDDNVELLLRAYAESGDIEMASHFEMDEADAGWEYETGPAVKKVVYDLLTPNRIILYPIPTLSAGADVYTFEAGDSNTLVGAELLGVVTSIDNYSMNSAFGAVSNLVQPGIEESFNSPFGVVTSISESDGALKVQYAKRPAEITTVDSVIELSESFRKAMLHLVCSNALTADIDAKANALADKHYQLYLVQMSRLKNNKAHNQVKGANARTIKRDPYAS